MMEHQNMQIMHTVHDYRGYDRYFAAFASLAVLRLNEMIFPYLHSVFYFGI